MVPANRRAPPLEGVHSTRIGGMWTLKHDIKSPKFYELLIKIDLKGDTALDHKNSYNYINMYLNAVTKLRKDLIPGYQSIKRHSQFGEFFIPYPNHLSYSRNVQIYTFLGHSLLVVITNEICVKSSMAPQAYKVVITHVHKISGCTVITRLINSRVPHLGGMNCDVQSDLAMLAFNN